jgi:hypothetical protein
MNLFLGTLQSTKNPKIWKTEDSVQMFWQFPNRLFTSCLLAAYQACSWKAVTSRIQCGWDQVCLESLLQEVMFRASEMFWTVQMLAIVHRYWMKLLNWTVWVTSFPSHILGFGFVYPLLSSRTNFFYHLLLYIAATFRAWPTSSLKIVAVYFSETSDIPYYIVSWRRRQQKEYILIIEVLTPFVFSFHAAVL